jgi:hypothetical protein
MLLKAVWNDLYHGNSASGTRCCDSVAKFSRFVLLLATYIAKQWKWNLLFCFHGKNGYVKSAQCYVRRMLPVLFLRLTITLYRRYAVHAYRFGLKVYHTCVYKCSWTVVWQFAYITGPSVLFSVSSRFPRKMFWNQWFHTVHLKPFKFISDIIVPNQFPTRTAIFKLRKYFICSSLIWVFAQRRSVVAYRSSGIAWNLLCESLI